MKRKFKSGVPDNGNLKKSAVNFGNHNVGLYNTGDHNFGDFNAGNYNYGSRNTGNHNRGIYNRGNNNSGNFNCGDWNTASDCVGCFNTEPPTLTFFNKPSDWTLSDWLESDAQRLLSEAPSCRFPWVFTKADTSAANQEWWDGLSEIDKTTIKAIPNFDAEIFKRITGIDVSESEVEQ